MKRPKLFSQVKNHFLIRFLSLIILLFLDQFSYGQQQGDSTFQQVRLARLGSQNDVYQKRNQSDKYLSAGFFYEFKHPLFNNKVSRAILFGLKNSLTNEYGLVIDHLGFTPTDIELPEIDTTDRPYAGLLYASFYRVSSNYKKGLQFRTSLKIGVMGPASGMEQVQTWIHEAIGDPVPIGWETQIGNSLVLDYVFKVTQKLPIQLSFFEIRASGDAELGTVFNIVASGLDFRLGLMNNWFVNHGGLYNKRQLTMPDDDKTQGKFTLGSVDRKFQLYAFFHPRLSYVIYDGTISGGLIPFAENPHTLPRSATEPWILYMNYGAVIQYKFFAFRYNRVVRSERFFQGDFFSWGRFDLAILF